MNRLSLVPIAAFLLSWQAAAFVSPLFIPHPAAAFVRLGEMLVTGEIFGDLSATFFRTVAGFVLGAGIGIVIGVCIGEYKRLASSLSLVIDFLRSLPATALFPLFLLMFGIGDEAKIAVVVFSASLIVAVNTMYGVRHQSRLRRQVASVYHIRGLSLLRHVILPGALPHIFAGLRIAASLSLVLVIVSEMFIGTTTGLGRIIIDAQLLYRLPELYAAIILTGILGYLLNRVVLEGERRIVHWRGT